MLSEMTCSASRTVGACIETSPVSPINVMFLRVATRCPKDSQPVAFTHSVASSLPTAANGRSLSGSENIAGSIPALRSTGLGSASQIRERRQDRRRVSNLDDRVTRLCST